MCIKCSDFSQYVFSSPPRSHDQGNYESGVPDRKNNQHMLVRMLTRPKQPHQLSALGIKNFSPKGLISMAPESEA